MYLKSVEIHGFKTFANKTLIEFGRGVTSVIGPNGCGKSNIVDAVRWALGEQSAKSLRGGEMLDVISNGSRRRKPSPFCEVTIVIDNSDQSLAVDNVEVSIRRKLYRNGDSEYWLNEQVSRLKAIRELFMDTGIGAKTNTVIEQEQLNKLLQASSKERKIMIEEAAGISRFRQRRQESWLKLSRVGDNMTRLKDIVSEVEKQKRSVSNQASKARRFENFQKELRSLKIDLAVIDLHIWINKRLDLEKQRETLKNGIDELRKREGQIQKDLRDLDTEEQRLETEMAKLQEEQESFFKEYSDVENRILENKERIKTLVNDIEVLESEISRFSDELTQAKESTNVEINPDEENAELNELVTEIEQIKTEIESKREDIIELRKKHASAQNWEIEMIRKKSLFQNEKIKIESSMEYVQRRLDQSKEKDIETDQKIETLSNKEEDPETQRILDETEKDRERRTEIQNTIGRIRNDLKELELELREHVSKNSGFRSRIDVLREMEEKFEGVGSGVRSILDLYVKDFAGEVNPGGCHGIVADLVTVPDDLVDALEAALGPRMQNLVFSSAEESRDAIVWLRKNKFGRATFLPIDRIRPRNKLDGKVLSYPGVRGEAFSLVGFDRRYDRLFSFLLNGTLVVETIEDGLRINKDHRVRIVTLAGDLISPEGAMTGGGKGHDSGLISRKMEIEELEAQLRETEESHNAQLDLHESLLKKEEKLHREVQIIEGRLKDQDQQTRQAEQRKHVDEQEVLRLKQEKVIIRREQDLLNEQMEKTKQELTDKQKEWDEMENQPNQNISDEDREFLQEKENNLKKLEAVAQERELKKVSIVERSQSQQREMQYKLDKANELEERLNRRKEIIAERRVEHEERSKTLDTAEARFAILQGEQNTQRSAFFEMKEKREGMRKGRRDYQEESIRVSGQLRKQEHEVSQISIKEEGLRVKQEELFNRFHQEMHLNIEDLYYGRREEEDEIFEREAEFELMSDEIQKRIQEIDVKLGGLGNVNFEAIEELKSLEEREGELKEQMGDLESSFSKLDDFIKGLDATCNEMFGETFEKVNEHFKIMFTRLFGGGKGELLIEKDVDPLEAGITIYAQPPGKSPKVLSQLSGGEKVLTTIAFLFSIFLYKPSPFCILDEVDAPLDEHNVDRLMEAVRSFTDQIQFLIVTHNRRTMSLCDIIHGVTMQETGVSNCISVDMDDINFDKNSEAGYSFKGNNEN